MLKIFSPNLTQPYMATLAATPGRMNNQSEGQGNTKQMRQRLEGLSREKLQKILMEILDFLTE